jgi:thiamine kinase-like enzyme
LRQRVFRQCRELFPEWEALSCGDFDFDEPKGFSSFTMGIRCRSPVSPAAVLYRRLAGKQNAILDFETEKTVYLTLAQRGIAAHCYHYDENFRIEAFYPGRTLQAKDLFEAQNLRRIADQLYRLHQSAPPGLPAKGFFDLLYARWGKLAKQVVEANADAFPPDEQAMCAQLREIYSPQTFARVRQCLPPGELSFCHNDTYHGNIMKLDDGQIRLLDFEFSCLNHKAYDFSNLFAETVMQHRQVEYPYFRIAEPEYGDRELGLLIDYYLDNARFASSAARRREFDRLLRDTRRLLMLSDYKYAMAALPLALDPVQKIRFIPYAYQRFNKFLAASEEYACE